MNVLITGGSGYIGKYLINYLDANNKCKITVLTRQKKINIVNNRISFFYYKEFSNINFRKVFSKIDVIIHLISKQHVTRIDTKNSYKEYYNVKNI